MNALTLFGLASLTFAYPSILQDRLPSPASINHCTVQLEVKQQPRQIEAAYLNDGYSLWIFPSFAVTEVELRTSSGGQPLFTPSGKLKLPTYEDGMAIRIRIEQVTRDSSYAHALMKEVQVDPSTRQVAWPDLQGEIGEELMVTSPTADRPLLCGHATMNSGSSSRAYDFKITPDTYAELKSCTQEDIALNLTYRYNGKLTMDDEDLSVNFLSNNVVKQLQHLSSATGDPSTFIVPVGGTESFISNLSSDTEETVSIRHLHRAGIPTGFWDKALSTLLEQLSKKMDIGAAQSGKVISFAFSNGLVASMPVNEINQFLDYHGTDHEDHDSSLVENTVHGIQNRDYGGSGSFTYLGIGGSSAGHVVKRSDDYAHTKQQKESFQKDIEELKKEFSGSVKFLSGMELTNDLNVRLRSTLKGYFNSASFTYETFTSSAPLSLSDRSFRAASFSR